MCASTPEPGMQFGTACMISHRPCYRSAEPRFYRCDQCGSLTVEHSPDGVPGSHFCCCSQMNELVCAPETGEVQHDISFVVFGGFEHNAIRISVDSGQHPMTEEHHIQWIYLYTFEGGQLKFLTPGQKPVITYAMADEDAYVYCGRDICKMGWERCQFQCKRGHLVYVFCSVHGLQKYRM